MGRHLLYIVSVCLWLAMRVDGMAQPLVLRHLGTEDGLPNPLVTDMEQDGRGFLWIATEAGLSRFDGKEFSRFDKVNSPLAGDALNVLLADKCENRLWVGSKSGMNWVDCTTMQVTDMPELDSLGMNNISSISFSAAPDSNVWVSNLYHRIVLCNRKSGHVLTCLDADELGIPESFRFVKEDNKGTLYIGHAGEGFGTLDLKTLAYRNYRHVPDDPNSLPGNNVRCACIDHTGNLWLGTNSGLALYRPTTDDFLVFRHEADNPHSLVSDNIMDLREMSDGTLWIASDIGGVNVLDLRDIAFTRPDKVRFRRIEVTYDKHGLSSGNIRSLLGDVYGNVWIGNHSSGVDFVSHLQPPFRVLPYLKRGNAIKLESVGGMCNAGQQGVWLGGINEVVRFAEGEIRQRVDLSSYLSRPYAQVSALSRGDDVLYVGLFDDGALRIRLPDGKAERLLFFDGTESHPGVSTFYRDTDGGILVGTVRGLYHVKEASLHPVLNVNRAIGGLSVYGILRDKQGKLWIGTYGNGIYVFDKDTTLVSHLYDKGGLCSNTVHQLISDKEGKGVWGALRGGIVRIADTRKPSSFRCYGRKDGLEDVYVHALHEDGAGNLWFSTECGISCMHREEGRICSYDASYGVPAGGFSDGSVCVDADSLFYFASHNGVCAFRPEDIRHTERISSVRIIKCRIVGRQGGEIFVSDGEELSLPFRQNSFNLRFSVADYAQSQQVEYAYRMEGLDREWTELQDEDQVTFRSVAPGTYTFQVKARLRNQSWDDASMASLTVEVLPPFWRTWYAKTFYLLLIIIGIYVWLRFYRRKLLLESSLEMKRREMQSEQNLNAERLRFYTNITHELRTPLTLIIGPLEDLANDPKLPAPYTHKIQVIRGSALRLLNLINQILEFRKAETQNRKLTVQKGNLRDLVMEIGLRYKELNRNPRVRVEVNIETEQTVLYFDSDIFTTILNNLLSNALKYTPEGEVRLTLRTVGSYTEIEVSDTGYGIEPDALPHIFDRYYQAEGKHQASGSGIGLALVKSLADLHEGVLNVRSEVGKGTVFTFGVRTDNVYPNALHKESPAVVPTPVLPEERVNVSPDTEKKNDRPVILAVEDNDDIREYIASSFGGYQVVTACNGKEGWEKAQQFIPDIIVSDVMMPEMDGIEFCRLVKEDMRTSHIPVILLTAKDSIQDKEEGYESGADSYLTKPFSAKLLQSRVRNLLESRRKLARMVEEQSKGLKPKGETDVPKMNKLDREFLDRLTRVIETNIESEKLDMPFIAEQMNMSHSTLYRKIKALTGASGNEFIRKVRLRYSVRLMVEEGYNISGAAFASGFNDGNYYRNCFKEEYGMLPSDYLKQRQQG